MTINGSLVSFPKSGRTWVRVMLWMLSIDINYTHDNSSHIKARHLSDLEIMNYDYNRPLLLLYRDPRDTAVSGYFQVTKRNRSYNGTIRFIFKC